MSLFQELPRRCIVLLEDVDSAGITKKRDDDDTTTTTNANKEENTSDDTTITKENEKKAGGLTLSALLNVIDGVAASEGRILVMTTNHADKLDPALLRPGRVDMTITFGYAAKADVEELFSAIYSTLEGDFGCKRRQGEKNGSPDCNGTAVADEKKADAQRVASLAAEFAKRVPEGEVTAAEIQGFLLNHKQSPENAIEAAEEWVESVRKKRATHK